MNPINAWTEFQPLKRVVLGAPFPPETFDWHKDEQTRRVMRQIFEETAEDLLKNDPQSDLFAEVQYRIAMTYALEGKLPEAAGAYRVVIERWSESSYAVEASFGLATVLEEQEELVEALKILEDLKGIYPKEDILTRKTEQVRERIEKKKKAI